MPCWAMDPRGTFSGKGHDDVVPHDVHAPPCPAPLVLETDQRPTLMVRDIPRTTDAMLDELSILYRERTNALDSLHQFVRTHPELEDDDDLVNARLALLADADRSRGTATERGYNTRGHQSFREAVLTRDPICVLCELRHSTIADHHPISRRDLIAAGMNPNDPQYGRGLCKPCHDRATAKNQPGGWNARRDATSRESRTKECKTADCSRLVRARGMCAMHYKRWSRSEGRSANPQWDEHRLSNTTLMHLQCNLSKGTRLAA
ncbi:hypothetical protein QYM36_019422 [Artemia franciscana]|uniref:Uncharacterized protein n=1 Tax=Artemia franciscana TaxID=6661 RepID=A0AA88KTD1_ARTSF|nr:hypothetical protein QYM36_019422 [Artemia franciscana]